jgi:uncharacterized protein YecE (DUF72 family)
MAQIRIEISGWSYDSWRGSFYPANLPSRRSLEFATSRFDPIEINASSYRLQTPHTFRKWFSQTPRGFRRAVEGNQFIARRLASRLNAKLRRSPRT